MGTSSKVYVIDPKEASALAKRAGKLGTERTDYSPNEDAQGGAARGGRARERLDEKGSPHMAFLSYLAGPFAVLTTRSGRDSRFWTTVAILAMIAAAGAAVAHEYEIFAASHGSGTAYLLWLGAACLAALMGFAGWARGVYLLGRHKGWLLKKLPAWVRHPGVAGIFGFVLPGLGLFASNHSRRAAAVLLAICAAAVSGIVLSQAPELWRLSQTAEAHDGFAARLLAGRGDTLEQMFLVMGATLCLGALVWVVQALDGMRLAGNGGNAKVQPHGDLTAVALILAVAALLVTFKPARVAETIDRFAVAARMEGMRAIPLYGVQAAMRLDPSRPEYVMQAIEMNEALGRPVEALALLRDLAERWKPFDRMLRLGASAAGNEGIGPEANR